MFNKINTGMFNKINTSKKIIKNILRLEKPSPYKLLQINEGATPHEILGVRMGASNVNIKQAYHKLALQWHPDVCDSNTISQEESKKYMI